MSFKSNVSSTRYRLEMIVCVEGIINDRCIIDCTYKSLVCYFCKLN